MRYLLCLFRAEIVKAFKIAIRYKFNTLFNIVFWAVLMLTLSHFLFHDKSGTKTWAFICSFMIWLIANNTFISVVDAIVSETNQGTLEQLYINSRSFFSLLFVKGCTAALFTMFQSILTFALCFLFVRQVSLVYFAQWCSLLPFMLLSVFSLIGLGVACASLTLRYKNMSSFYGMVSSIVFGVLTYGAVGMSKSYLFMMFFPFAKANAILQLCMIANATMGWQTFLTVIFNDTVYLLLGYICLLYLIKKGRQNGSLSKF